MARELVITPKHWSPRGEAELSVQGRRMQVWSGIPGESVRVRVVHEGQNSDYAIVRDVLKADPHRVQPRCDRYHTCGGCPLMHLDAAGQRTARRRMVLDALAEFGLEDVEVGEVVPSPDGEDDFRWVAKLGVGVSEHGRIRVGAWGRMSRSVVPIPHCNVVADPLRKAMTAVAHHVIDLGIRPYDPERDEGVLRAVVLRGSRATREVLVTLVAGNRVRALDELAFRLVSEASEISGIALHLNDDPGNAIFTRDPEGAVLTTQLEGRAFLEDSLLGITYRIGPGDFFQTNPGMAEALYRDTLDRLDLRENEAFVDLYSGVGGLALPAAQRTGWALGVEEVATAVESARDAARRNGLSAEFVADRVEAALPAIQRRLGAAHPVVAVNPARRGLEAGVVDGIAALRPSRLAYISCNPRALARDLVALRDKGLRLGPIALYDMFPNTAHVECVALLSSDVPASEVRRAPRRRTVGRDKG